jgi:hypothetical protein
MTPSDPGTLYGAYGCAEGEGFEPLPFRWNDEEATFTTAWTFTEEEIEAMRGGGRVILGIMGAHLKYRAITPMHLAVEGVIYRAEGGE